MFEVLGVWRKARSRSRVAAKTLGLIVSLFVLFLPGLGTANAQTNWALDPTASVLTYQSVKKNTIVETNKIRNISGSLTSTGDAKVSFDLNSVDTGVDLRNVRMRFLFFETYKFPTAELTAKVDPAAFADLATKRRMKAVLPFRLNLHGVDKDLEANVVVTMISDTMVSVASEAPVAVHVEDFGLLPNVDKLQQAASVTNIVPTASVSFDFVFTADGSKPPPPRPLRQAPRSGPSPPMRRRPTSTMRNASTGLRCCLAPGRSIFAPRARGSMPKAARCLLRSSVSSANAQA
ncbi:YceI family protein [Mesorhizobium sp. ORM16]|uniref:YceI family protein n=1 Tax=Mesorhizobium sp. ORM16 TaxID=3376989 RepID=UPI00385747EE